MYGVVTGTDRHRPGLRQDRQVITRRECPIDPCKWVWDEPEPELPDIGADPYTVLRARLAGTESVIRAHVETHPLLDWVQEVMRLRGELDRERRDSSLVAGVLLRRLGLSAFVSDTEMTGPHGTLQRIPVANGFILEVTP